MKRIIRLTESDLKKIVKKVLKENDSEFDKLIEFGEYAELVKKSEMKIMNELLLLIRKS